MKSGYHYDAKTCFRCGNLVYYNWYIRHRRSGCVSGIVTPLRLTSLPPDACGGESVGRVSDVAAGAGEDNR